MSYWLLKPIFCLFEKANIYLPEELYLRLRNSYEILLVVSAVTQGLRLSQCEYNLSGLGRAQADSSARAVDHFVKAIRYIIE